MQIFINFFINIFDIIIQYIIHSISSTNVYQIATNPIGMNCFNLYCLMMIFFFKMQGNCVIVTKHIILLKQIATLILHVVILKCYKIIKFNEVMIFKV